MADDPFPSYRFYIEINQVKQAMFLEVGGLQVEIQTTDYAEGGNNTFVHRLPGPANVSNVTLKRGMATSNTLFKWCMQAAQGNVQRYNIAIVCYDTVGQELMRWTFLNAYPVRWIGPQFKADDKAMAIESLELAHEGLQME